MAENVCKDRMRLIHIKRIHTFVHYLLLINISISQDVGHSSSDDYLQND